MLALNFKLLLSQPPEQLGFWVHTTILSSLFVALIECSQPLAPGSKPAASLFYPSPTHHFITGPGALALELGKLSTVVDGDEQFPDGQECHSNQEDAANHSQQDGHGIGGTSALCKEGARRQVGKTISTPAMPEVKGYTLPSVHPPSCCLCESLPMEQTVKYSENSVTV